MSKVCENETVADIVKRVRRDCNSYPLPTAAAEMLKLVREIESAHQREVAELKRQREEALTIVNEVEKCASIERHTEAMLKKNEVIAGLRKEVAELRECLNRRSKHINTILQKALELGESVPLELREVMDDCIVAEDKAIGLGVFSSTRGGAK